MPGALKIAPLLLLACLACWSTTECLGNAKGDAERDLSHPTLQGMVESTRRLRNVMNGESVEADAEQGVEDEPEVPSVSREQGDRDVTDDESPINPINEKKASDAQKSIIAVVTAYSDDVSWILAEDYGGSNWTWRVPTEINQISDLDDDCLPTFPGMPAKDQAAAAIRPLPDWPEWAQEWVAEACEAKKRGITPASREHSLWLAARDAGVEMPTIKSRSLLSTQLSSNESNVLIDAIRNSTVEFEQLTPIPLHIIPNKANEALGVLDGLVRHYDNPPDLLLFMHGHLRSWHTFSFGQDWVLDRLAFLPARNLSSGYMQLGCFEPEDKYNRLFPIILDANHRRYKALGPRWHESFAAHYMQAWREHLGEAFGMTHPPKYIHAACCATFAVSKEALHRWPKEFYLGMREWAMKTSMEKNWLGVIFEFSYHLMFTGLGVYDPPQSQCLCELYDICMNNKAEGGP